MSERMVTHEKINDLKPHPRNAEFFDDITGDKWNEFLNSIKTNGVIEPIIITPRKVIVSGHQRVRACRELGYDEIECITKQYKDDDAILLDLIETNIRQRGNVGGSAQKIGKRIKELERLYGVRQGSAGTPKSGSATQTDLQKELGLGKDAYANYKKLADMVPELSEAVDAGTVTQSAALAMMKQLSEDEQLELLSCLDATKKYTQKETEALINEIAELKAKPPEVIEKIPDDYDRLKCDVAQAQQEAEGVRADYKRARSDLEKRTAERDELKNKLDTIEAADSGNARKKHQIDTGAMFNARVSKFIEEVAGYVWLTDEINELPEGDRKMFIHSIEKIQEWANQMQYNIQKNMEENKNGK